jgi:hypothetical protein
MPQPEPVRALPVSDKDAQTIQRALIDYRRLLTLSTYAEIDVATVDAEIRRVDTLAERLSLNVFYADYNHEGDDYGRR